MKHIATLTCLLLTIIATPVFAVPGNDCASRSEKIKPADREDFMKSCLAQVGTPANVKEAKQKHKSALCEQNAKNKKLQGSDKGNYQADCVNKNEAVVAANSLPSSNTDTGKKSASAGKPKSEPRKAAVKKPAAKKQNEHKKSGKKKEQKSAPASGASEAL
jgi:hypothetical protein